MENMELKNKRILITGATSYLAKRFLPLLNHNELLKIDRNDVLKNNFEKVVLFDPQVVFHFATVYGKNGETDQEISKVNFELPQKLFADLKHGIFVNCDTKLPRMVSSYALYKNLFREWAHSQVNESKRFLNVKLEHFYGPQAPPHNFVTSVANKLLKNEDIPLTQGQQQRDFIYIDDCVEGMHLSVCDFLNKSVPFQEIELGSGEAISIRDLVSLMKKISGSKSNLKFGAVEQRANEVMFSAAKMDYLNQLGFEPRTNLEKGLSLLLAKDRH